MAELNVSQLRVVLVVPNVDDALRYYRDSLGLTELAAMAGPKGARVAILAAGQATLELANEAQAAFIAEVETDGTPSTPVRLAFQVDDAVAAVDVLGDAPGARLIAAPRRTPWGSLNARLDGPAGVQVTLFQDSALPLGQLIGAALPSIGGEPGVLARTVEAARVHGSAGQLPFAAVVALDGTVIGAGVNTALTDLDPAAHAEVTAIRDAARRTGSADLRGAVVYSSCEPCAICRTVAAAAGVGEIVFAAGKESVPPAMNPDPQTTGRLIDAVSAVLPGIARRADTGLSAEQLSAPFHAYLVQAA